MKDVYKLYYKSSGGNATNNVPVDYHATVAEIEADNFEELGKIATDIIEDLGLPLDDFGVNVDSNNKEYENAIATNRAEKFFTNHTGKY